MSRRSVQILALALIVVAIGILGFSLYQSSHGGAGSVLTVVGLGVLVAGLGVQATARRSK